ncbi:MAG: winged helix-turn-helix transcriptional regulator, partial [Eubacteriales bacterium]|nr:winged helix-turn-helix transcriptional regulator [Eubacteriales bacterium]
KNQGETKEKIIELLRNNPYITQKEMRESLGLSQGGIEYQIRNLKQDSVIKRVGGDRGGHWEIL